MLIFSGGGGSTGPPDYAYDKTQIVDETLVPYIELIIWGSGGSGSAEGSFTYYNGTISWIGSPTNPVNSIENIHVVMYTRLTNNESTPKRITVHLGVYPGEIQLPVDITDYDEIIVPLMGLDSRSYDFNICCLERIY